MKQTSKINQFKSKVYSFVNLYVPQLVHTKSKSILNYGVNNLFPNELLKTLAESGTATSCVEKLSQFIDADGFQDESSSNLMVNEKQTADGLLTEISSAIATFSGFSLFVRRTADGKINSVEYIDFELIRKTKDGNFIYNKYYGTEWYKESEDTKYPAFKGVNITREDFAKQIQEFGSVGEIIYSFKQQAGKRIYPIPSYYAGIEDIKTDAELSKFEYETAVNSFVTSAILTIVGEVDNKTKDDRGKTDQDYLDDTLQEFTGAIKNSKGHSGRNKLTVLSAKTREEVPVLQNFDTKAIMDAASGATDRVARKVARLFGVPSFLVGLDGSTGFNTKMIVDQIDLFNKNINGIQRQISEVFETLYPSLDWTITTFKPIGYVDSEVYAKLTDDEIRAIAGYKPLVKNVETNESDKIITAVNSLSPLVANKVLDSLSVDEIRGLVGLTKKEIPNANSAI